MTQHNPETQSPLVSRITAEIAEKQALLETVKAIEAGAEWEVYSSIHNQWSSPYYSLQCCVGCGQKIRLKSAPEPAPLWDCAADVPMNCRMRRKGYTDSWAVPNHTYPPGIELVGRLVSWRRMDEWEYTLDGVTFHECRKGGPR